jgi:Polysaccharide lyase
MAIATVILLIMGGTFTIFSQFQYTKATSTANSQEPPTHLDFETGDISQWKCKEDLPPTNTLQVVGNPPPAQGKFELKTTLTKDAKIVPGTNGVRAELFYCDSPNHAHLFGEGNSVWYHWYSMFPNDFTPPGPKSWEVWTQWHALEGTTSYGVPLGFALNGNTLNLRVLGGVFDKQDSGCTDKIIIQGKPNTDCGFLWAAPLQKAKWYEILLHVIWSSNKNVGLVEGIVNGTSIIPYHGVTLNPNGSDDTKVYLKQGLYRALDIHLDQTIYHDGMIIANCPPDSKFDPSTETCSSASSGGTTNVNLSSVGPAVSSFGTDHLNVYVLGSDHALWYRSYHKDPPNVPARWHDWIHVGNGIGASGHPPNVNITSSPAAVSMNSTRVDVFAWGSDNHSNSQIWQITGDLNSGSWSEWKPLGKPAQGNSNSTLPTLLKRLGFENGVGPPNGVWEWNSAQYAAPDRLTAVTSPIKEGLHALKATVHHGDYINNGARAELLLDNPTNYFHDSDDVWYHWYTMFPSGFQTTPGWQVWTQWHQGDDSLGGGPAVEFNVDGKTKNLDLRVMPPFWDSQHCYTVEAGQCGYQWVQPIKTGVWYEMLFHVKWSKNDTLGSVELWVNGTKVVPCASCKTTMATLDVRDPTSSVYLKQGLYLEDVITQPQSVFHDGMEVVKCPSDHQYYHPDTKQCYTTPTQAISSSLHK